MAKRATEKGEHRFKVIFTGDWPSEVAEAYKQSIEENQRKSRVEKQQAKSTDEKARGREKRTEWDPDVTIEFKCSHEEWRRRLQNLVKLAIG